MRVGVVIGDLDATGAPSNYIASLALQLHENTAVTPVVISRRGDPGPLSKLEHLKLPDRSYPTAFLPDRPLPPRLQSIATRGDIDIFHLNDIPDVGHLSAFEAATPVVATVHGTLHWETLPISVQERGYRVRRRWFDRLGRFSVDRLFAVSDYVKQTLLEKAGYAPRQVTTTYEAIDVSFFTCPKKAPSSGDGPDRYLLHVSNAAPKKNLETLLYSFQTLSERHRDLELVIAGRGWQERHASLASTLGIEDVVHFFGYVPQRTLIRLYDDAICFVYPSLHETFGLPNVEAMARHTPVVTTDAFAIPEIVDGGALLIEDPRDETTLTEAVERVLDDPELRQQLTTSGVERATDFSWDSHLSLVVDAYRGVI